MISPICLSQGRLHMAVILTLLVFSGGNVALATAEYRTAAACEAAKDAAAKAFAVTSTSKVVGTCTPKG